MRLFIIDGITDRRQAEAVMFVYLCERMTASKQVPSRRQSEFWKSPKTTKGTKALERTCNLHEITCLFSVFVLQSSCEMSTAVSLNHGM